MFIRRRKRNGKIYLSLEIRWRENGLVRSLSKSLPSEMEAWDDATALAHMGERYRESIWKSSPSSSSEPASSPPSTSPAPPQPLSSSTSPSSPVHINQTEIQEAPDGTTHGAPDGKDDQT